jgi:hypothetical protein
MATNDDDPVEMVCDEWGAHKLVIPVARLERNTPMEIWELVGALVTLTVRLAVTEMVVALPDDVAERLRVLDHAIDAVGRVDDRMASVAARAIEGVRETLCSGTGAGSSKRGAAVRGRLKGRSRGRRPRAQG